VETLESGKEVADVADPDPLMAALRNRLENKDAARRPLGREDVGADKMSHEDVLTYVMNSLQADPDEGLRVLLSFSFKTDKVEDFMHQVSPGAYADVPSARADIESRDFYRELLEITEYKRMGPADMSNLSRNAAAKFLVRSSGNWKQLDIKMQLFREPDTTVPRWIILNIYMSGN
jgi:hypothetical protein